MKRETTSKIAGFVLNILLHGAFAAVIVYFIWPILTLYFNQKPAVGIDLFLSVDFVTYIRDHLTWPFLIWQYIWYGGTPLAQTYPLFHFYLIQPLLAWFSVVQAVQIYILFAMVLYIIFSYLFFYSLSKNRGLSAVLAIATAYSYNLWSPLYWSGSIPYAATMFLLPLSLWLVVLSYEKRKKKFIYLAGLLTGIFIQGHPQSFIGYTVPLTTILILFYGSKQVRVFSWDKVRTILIYGLIIFLVGFPQAGVGVGVIGPFLKVLGSAFTSGAGEIAQSTYAVAAKETAGSPIARMLDLYRRTNPLFFSILSILGLFVFFTTFLSIVVKRRVSHHIKWLLPIFLMAAYVFLFIYGFVVGVNPLSGGWFRVFWPAMTVYGALAAVLWRVATDNLENIIGKWERKKAPFKFTGWVFGGAAGLTFLYLGIVYLKSTYIAFEKETLAYVSESSAFPTAVSLNLEKGNWPEKLPQLTPVWMDPNSLNWRLYDMDATFNIWWNSVFKMPLARGYLDASPKGPSGENYAGWQYLQNITLNKNEVVERWETPRELAANQAKFFLDWHAIKYLESFPVYGRNYSSAASDYVVDPANIEASGTASTIRPAKFFQIEGRGWDIPETVQELKYYSFKDSLVSPIYNATNAPSILVIGDAIGQDTMMRDLSFLDFNSRKAIIVQWNDKIDSLSEKNLANFDVVVLYRYKYKNASSAFKKLGKYVKGGGKLFIDTGPEQKESSSADLPTVFPFQSAERKQLGKGWDWQIEAGNITKDVNFQSFGAPLFDNQEWNFAYPTGGLRPGAQVVLSNHNKPVLVDYHLGEGRVIWSGMNLAGHVQRYKSLAEVRLLKNILFEFADFSQDKNVVVEAARPSSEKAIIKGSGAKAILFKESAYPGWSLTVRSENKSYKLPIYEAGPTVHGYMYAVLPREVQGKPFVATFQYHGERVYVFTYIFSYVAALLVIDSLFLKAYLSKRILKRLVWVTGFVRQAWDKESEE